MWKIIIYLYFHLIEWMIKIRLNQWLWFTLWNSLRNFYINYYGERCLFKLPSFPTLPWIILNFSLSFREELYHGILQTLMAYTFGQQLHLMASLVSSLQLCFHLVYVVSPTQSICGSPRAFSNNLHASIPCLLASNVAHLASILCLGILVVSLLSQPSTLCFGVVSLRSSLTLH